ncbi:hypothetical protein QE152_g8807 [Popillia japonica]|uniref:Uncharacterized protein n=1 Tax=Popillia japonica TaxID=7064 RepID=A0AAW1M153_POPJA
MSGTDKRNSPPNQKRETDGDPWFMRRCGNCRRTKIQRNPPPRPLLAFLTDHVQGVVGIYSDVYYAIRGSSCAGCSWYILGRVLRDTRDLFFCCKYVLCAMVHYLKLNCTLIDLYIRQLNPIGRGRITKISETFIS